jgi:hypothetical protein
MRLFTTLCKHCNLEFKSTRQKQLFCSRTCHTAYHNANKGNRYKIPCPICGDPMVKGSTTCVKHRAERQVGHEGYHKASGKYYKSKGEQRVHQALAEKAIGRPLVWPEQVHHLNGEKNGGPLVICPDTFYHKMIHYRQKALDITGDKHNLYCQNCGQWDNPSNIHRIPTRSGKDRIQHIRPCKKQDTTTCRAIPDPHAILLRSDDMEGELTLWKTS